MSDGPSIRYHRITKPDFRPCSTCWSRSQAPFCLCTLRMISNHSEGTLGRLRYILGGDRPSQTARLTRSPYRIHGSGLELRYDQGGIPTAPPQKLALLLQRLPPILYRPYQSSISSYSKAPWGLSVLSWEACIFTGNTISPSLSLRQRSSRYAIRAGQNLPDKEFRYLRTVIVTAAVHWGFSSHREALPLTFQHRAGVSPYTSSFELAETCVFGKQSLGLFSCGPDMPQQLQSLLSVWQEDWRQSRRFA